MQSRAIPMRRSISMCIMSMRPDPFLYRGKSESSEDNCKHTCNLLYTQNKVKFIFGNFERVG